MASDELKWALEEIKEKFDLVMEAFNRVRETLDRHIEENRKEHQELTRAIRGVQVDVSELRRDLNDHRDNTELHTGSKRKKA